MVLLFRIAGWMLIVIGAAVASYAAANMLRNETDEALILILVGSGVAGYGWLLARKPEAEDDDWSEPEERDESWGW